MEQVFFQRTKEEISEQRENGGECSLEVLAFSDEAEEFGVYRRMEEDENGRKCLLGFLALWTKLHGA